ncbi:hypothetical protein [Fulvivirga ligni]|uniref:hypothetical protein n=1 Tax=Fulvivirga ligni TaxID=2904246 RepID=UPI001F45C8FF|nr:hypothetical protein [Fulvivirga ligni]UII22950.1 hypothetical protein LVD16_06905 [Fulvivirga ligni]
MISVSQEILQEIKPQHSGEDILKFIPQRSPFVMVSALYDFDEDSVLSGFDIEEGNPLVDDGVLTEGGLTENMAQTAALFAGSKAQASGKPAPVGFIASIKGLNIEKSPAVGEHIFTTIQIVNEVMNVQIAQARSFNKNMEPLAECEIRIFLQPTEENA